MATATKKLSLYPAYLNANKTRQEGRRIPKAAAVADPNVREIAEVLKCFEHKLLVEDKVYPRERSFEEPTFRGRVQFQVPSSHPEFRNKQTLLLFVAEQIGQLNRKQFTMASLSTPNEPTPTAEPEKPKKSGRRNNRKK
jgi:signal recognition particle subunit SEC65